MNQASNKAIVKNELNMDNFYMMKYPIIEAIEKSDLSRSDKSKLRDSIIELERLKVILKGYDRKKKYLSFEPKTNINGSTQIMRVTNSNGDNLGRIKWYGPYRGYTFDDYQSIFDTGCLFEIITKINSMNDAHIKGKKS